jgi:hypothetical protein
MTTFLFLFHSTVGVVRMRKALQAAGMTFEVKDIPRQLRSGCGLCIYLSCMGDEQRWVIPGETAALFRVAGNDYHLLATYAHRGSPDEALADIRDASRSAYAYRGYRQNAQP